MKKILSQISILVMLLATLTPINNVGAQVLVKYGCFKNGLLITSTISKPINSAGECTQAGGQWQVLGNTPPTPTTPTPTLTQPTNTTSGSCWNPQNDKPAIGIKTQAECVSPYKWISNTPTPTPAPTPAPTKEANPVDNYVLLQPLPCEVGTPNCDTNGQITSYKASQTQNAIGTYLNVMLRIFIGLCAVLAMIMIVMGGLEYMTSELISSKESGKQKITGAVLGLLLALGSWALLYTINPKLINSDLSSITDQEVKVSLDAVNFAKTEQTVATSGSGFKLKGSTTNGVDQFITNHLQKGESLRAISVDTNTKTAYFYTGPEGDWSTYVAVPINVGFNGVSEISQGVPGDGKTPKGTTTISNTYISNSNNSITDGSGKFNLGPAFINIGTNRGIGFHGAADTTSRLGTTNGCIRMSNDDLKALAPYMKSGVKVIIK